jgi:hypothetical protein
MSAFDAVDGARSAASKCYSGRVEGASNEGGEATANVEAGALKDVLFATLRFCAHGGTNGINVSLTGRFARAFSNPRRRANAAAIATSLLFFAI